MTSCHDPALTWLQLENHRRIPFDGLVGQRITFGFWLSLLSSENYKNLFVSWLQSYHDGCTFKNSQRFHISRSSKVVGRIAAPILNFSECAGFINAFIFAAFVRGWFSCHYISYHLYISGTTDTFSHGDVPGSTPCFLVQHL